MRSNGGKVTTNKQGKLGGHGYVWYSDKYITNVLALKDVTKRYRVTYDSAEGGGFIVHRPGKLDICFECDEEGLHFWNPRRNKKVSFVETVEENSRGYSQRQLKHAMLARELYAKVGHPSVKDLSQ